MAGKGGRRVQHQAELLRGGFQTHPDHGGAFMCVYMCIQARTRGHVCLGGGRASVCLCAHVGGCGPTYVCASTRVCVRTCARPLGSLIRKEGEAGTAWEQARASPDVLSAPRAACAKSIWLLPL